MIRSKLLICGMNEFLQIFSAQYKKKFFKERLRISIFNWKQRFYRIGIVCIKEKAKINFKNFFFQVFSNFYNKVFEKQHTAPYQMPFLFLRGKKTIPGCFIFQFSSRCCPFRDKPILDFCLVVWCQFSKFWENPFCWQTQMKRCSGIDLLILHIYTISLLKFKV